MKVFNIETVTVDEVYDYLSDYDRLYIQEEFDNFLDESTEDIEIFGIRYTPSYVFKNADIVRYDMELDEYIFDVAKQIVEGVKSGETVEMYNCSFK